MNTISENDKQKSIDIRSRIIKDVNGMPDVPPEGLEQIKEVSTSAIEIEANGMEAQEPIFTPPSHTTEEQVTTTTSDSTNKKMENLSQELLQRIEQVKNGNFSALPLNTNFEKCVKDKDRTRTIGLITNDELWNGNFPPCSFYNLASFIWRVAPDFFNVPYDSDRAIIEDKAEWTKAYFNKQRNYHRHNFCLERFCHLIMVYEYLYSLKTQTPIQPKSQQNSEGNVDHTRKNPQDVLVQDSRSLSNSTGSRGIKKVKGGMFAYAIIAAIILIAAVAIILTHNKSDSSSDHDTQQVTCSVCGKKFIPDNSTNATTSSHQCHECLEKGKPSKNTSNRMPINDQRPDAKTTSSGGLFSKGK